MCHVCMLVEVEGVCGGGYESRVIGSGSESGLP